MKQALYLLVLLIVYANAHVLPHKLHLFRPDLIEVEIDSDVSVQAQPSLLSNTDEWVNISFSGVKNPSIYDWVAVYSPSNVDFSETSPVKYQYANVSEEYISTGSGFLSFRLVNMHADYLFALMTGSFYKPTIIGLSNTVSFENIYEPLQGHIALTENPNEIKIMWNSGDTQKAQYVIYGTSSGSYTMVSNATQDTYTKDDMCGGDAKTFGWRNPGILQTAVLSNLTPGKIYYYVYGGEESGFSEEQFFYGPQTTMADTEVVVCAYGDMGKSEIDKSFEHWTFETASLNTTYGIINQLDELDLVIHIGDISYAVGFGAQWDEFMDQVAPISQRLPYMTLPGNHERDFPNSGAFFNTTDSGGECGIPYEKRFPMPNVDRETQWYSFDYGNIHFVMMSTEHVFSVDSPQYQFIAQDLASVDRSVTPWIILSGHRPMYIDSQFNGTAWSDQVVATELQNALEDLLVKYNVNLCLWGHHHSYQRTCPLYKGECQSSGAPVHVVIGMAGFRNTRNLDKVPPSWIEFVDDMEYGFSKITTTKDSLLFEYFSNESGVKDSFTL